MCCGQSGALKGLTPHAHTWAAWVADCVQQYQRQRGEPRAGLGLMSRLPLGGSCMLTIPQ